MPPRMIRPALAATAALALGAVTVLGQGAQAAPGDQEAARSAVAAPISLSAPRTLTVQREGGVVYSDLGLRAIAHDAAFELRSTRASYGDPIRTVWESPTGEVALPPGTQTDFNSLPGLIDLTFTRVGSNTPAVTTSVGGCLSNYVTERVTPDAPATSPYPRNCYYNPYSLGSVQGIQTGWATSLMSSWVGLPLKKGRYTATVSIAEPYASSWNLAPQDSTRTIDLTVVKGEGPIPVDRRDRADARSDPSAPGSRPTAARDGAVPTTAPDLRSLPAWGIGLSPSGNRITFAATVWNAGTSPLVVDGFRRDGEDLMDAYQYFFDADGEQTGYQQVGRFEWDPRPTHQHWHFEDFATYTLLDSTQTEIERSKKEAFCLANTDAVDLTVQNAVWNVDNSDLSTACGDYSSLSVREVLASGWGDTYAQFRAGQAFGIKDLPNGTYYIRVAANPQGNLVESDTTNNVALRRIVLGGKPGKKRTLTVDKVGLIDEGCAYGGGGIVIDRTIAQRRGC